MKQVGRQRYALLAAAAVVSLLFAVGLSSGSYAATSRTAPAAQGSHDPTTNTMAEHTKAPLFHLLPARIQKAGKIIIGSAIEYPPFEYYAPDGKTPIGFEVDLATAIAQELGVKFQWENASFDTLFDSLKAGRYDIVYGDTNDTPTREKLFDMVDYGVSRQVFLVARGNPDHLKTIEDLCGKAVAVITGSIQAHWLNGPGDKICAEKGKPKIHVLTFAGLPGVQLSMYEGRAAASLSSFASASAGVKASKGRLEVVLVPHTPRGRYAMVVPKSDPQLTHALQVAWQAIMKNGEYDEIMTKWHMSPLSASHAYVNGMTTHPFD